MGAGASSRVGSGMGSRAGAGATWVVVLAAAMQISRALDTNANALAFVMASR